MNNQSVSLTTYLIESIIKDINTGNVEALNILSDNVLDKSHLELLRSKYSDLSIDRLVKMINDHNQPPLFLYELLPRNSKYDSVILKILLGRWNQAQSFAEKFHILFRITDFDITNNPVSEEALEFVIVNYPEFCNRLEFWVKNSNEDPYDYMISRIKDERFPITKDWLYLFSGSVTEKKKNEFVKYIDKLKKDGNMPFMCDKAIQFIENQNEYNN